MYVSVAEQGSERDVSLVCASAADTPLILAAGDGGKIYGESVPRVLFDGLE